MTRDSHRHDEAAPAAPVVTVKRDAVVPGTGAVPPVDGHCPAAHATAGVGRGREAGYLSSWKVAFDLSNQGSFFGQLPGR